MNINAQREGNTLTIRPEGRIDTVTVPAFQQGLEAELGDVDRLVIDFSKVSYISSAGLRVLLSAQKVMNKQGKMFIRNVCPEIKEIFDVTGFADILTIV